MAAIVTGCLGAVGGKVGELILSQFNYLYCFSDNITNLQNEAGKLEVLERDLQGKVQAARDAVRVITNEAETWLNNSKEIKNEINGILNEVPNVESGCFRLGARFSLSKRARETADRVKELQDHGRFVSITRPRPPAATKAIPERSIGFKSRKKIEEDIMTLLKREDVNMVGICGMGGLGKTTMAKRIMNRALAKDVIDEVVMAVVSRPIDKLKIQLEIGGSLGLKLEGESSQARMQKLHKRLSGTKRTLVVLDDVWETLELEDLGIPHSYERCTILLTSRSRDVLSGMSVNIFGMELLSEEDSWFLFKEKVGSHEDDTELNSIAKEDTELNSIAKDVVKECGRLPIALITVGAALKDKVHVAAWRNALRQLKRHDPDIPNFIEKVYKPLELSYDVLEHKYQLVFLLCGLYPEDADIPLERLTYLCMGLRLFDGGMVEERERMHSLIDVLKNRSLLLDSNRGDDYVRMHDVVRDVCKHITRKNKYIIRSDSSLQSYEFISGFGLLQIRNSADEEIKFDGISDLYVLSIERCSQLTSLPFTQRPNNLITLVLDSCEGLETLSVVGELVNLEILICRGCDSIEELPSEIKGLKQLKVLDLTKCINLKRIGRGIISSLVGLEELKMLQSFDKWEAEDREERENAGLKELGQLTKLRCLEIEIEDAALVAENIGFSSEVDRFTIIFLYESRWFSKFGEYLSNKKMCLKWEGARLGDWIKKLLLRDTECLLLVGNGANEVGSLTNLEKIRYLELAECESMKKVVTSLPHTTQKLINLNTLVLDRCKRVETLSVVGELENLEILICRGCDSIEELPPEIKRLNRLKVLDLTGCKNLQRIGRGIVSSLVGLEELRMLGSFKKWEGQDREKRENAGLRELGQLPNLRCLEIEIEDLALAAENIRLSSEVDRFTIRFSYRSPWFQSPWFSKFDEYLSNKKMCLNWEGASCLADWIKVQLLRDTECLLLVGNGANEVGLTDLEKKIRYLELGECESMKKVVTSSMDKGGATVFPSIENLLLFKLPKLEEICDDRISSNSFQNLKILTLDDLPVLKQLWMSSQNDLGKDFLPQLEVLEIRRCGMMETVFLWKGEDGNEVIEEKEEEKEKVVSGAQRTTILFPKLHKIVLYELSELVRFCEWKCDVELPSLTEVVINQCHTMKRFTLGPLNTPKLESVDINRKEFGGVKDLNDILQQQYINRTEKKQAEEAEKKKGGEEEQERKGETEEEQN